MSGGMITSDVSGKADVVMDADGQMLYYNSGRQALDKEDDDDVLTLKSGLPSWEASAGGATVTIQEDHITSPISTTSTTFVDTGITATISQSSGTSYVNACLNWHINPANQLRYRIVEGANNQPQQMEEERSGNTPFVATQDGVFVNASQVVKIQWNCNASTLYCDDGNGRSGLWIMEVA